MNPTLVIGDFHIPEHDELSLKTLFKAIPDIKPKEVVIIGDLIDFYQVSMFRKDPKRVLELQDDIDAGNVFLDALDKATPGVPKIFIRGNHEVRLQKFTWDNPVLSSLRAMRIPDLFEFKRRDYLYREDYYKRGAFIFTHGDKYNEYAAKAQYMKWHCSGMSGHSHRFGMWMKTTFKDTYGWWINGCLQKPNHEQGIILDWQQGFSVVYFADNYQRFHVTQIPIIGHQFVFNGKLYKP